MEWVICHLWKVVSLQISHELHGTFAKEHTNRVLAADLKTVPMEWVICHLYKFVFLQISHEFHGAFAKEPYTNSFLAAGLRIVPMEWVICHLHKVVSLQISHELHGAFAQRDVPKDMAFDASLYCHSTLKRCILVSHLSPVHYFFFANQPWTTWHICSKRCTKIWHAMRLFTATVRWRGVFLCCVAVHFSVLQCVAVCCSALQYVAVCHSLEEVYSCVTFVTCTFFFFFCKSAMNYMAHLREEICRDPACDASF